MDTPRFALSWTPDKKCKIVTFEILRSSPGRHCSDLLNAETTQVLLDIIHAEYERRFGQKMKYCSASFMDEPSPAGIYPWTRSLPEEFFKDHNYELLPNLPHLVLDIAAASPRIRNDYRKTLHRLLCQNYLEPVKKWLNERNIASAGHLTRSEYLTWSGHLWPNELRCFKYFDIPCCDPLGAGTGKPGCMAHHIGIKAVSSAARLFKKCAQVGCGIELNINWWQLDDPELEPSVMRPYFIAKECGCKFYMGSDAHHPNELDGAMRRFERIVDILDLKESDKFDFCL